MDTKRNKDIAKKQLHRRQLSTAKSHRKHDPDLQRSLPKLNANPVILIVCEGKNTEPSYFNQFKLSSATIKALGKGYNTLSLVKHALFLSQQKKYDKIWVVFDKDNHTNANFNNAIKLAQSHSFGVAYSNQAFEYWLILHFNDHQGSKLDRSNYEKIINDFINPMGAHYDGDGNKLITKEFFRILDSIDPKTSKPRIELAINRAKKIDQYLLHHSPANEESSTTVYKLIETILNYI
jgi:hypothetical protein